MISSTAAERRFARKHIVGEANSESVQEVELYANVRRSLMDNLKTKYVFYFNQPIPFFGVVSKDIRISDYSEPYKNFIMTRCHLDYEDATSFYKLIAGQTMSPNEIRLDAAKMLGNKLVLGVELNESQHYDAERCEDKAKFARQMFADFIKREKLTQIGKYVECDLCARRTYGIGSKRSIEVEQIIYSFIYEL